MSLNDMVTFFVMLIFGGFTKIQLRPKPKWEPCMEKEGEKDHTGETGAHPSLRPDQNSEEDPNSKARRESYVGCSILGCL